MLVSKKKIQSPMASPSRAGTVIDSCRILHISVYVEDFLYSKEGSEERLKVEKIVKPKQPEIYKQLKQERKENLSFNFL